MNRREILVGAGAAAAFGILGRAEVAQAEVSTPKTAEKAAEMYGADDYTGNAANWELFTFNDGNTTGAHLIPDSEGNHHRVSLKGAVAEGYLDLKDGGEVDFFQEGRRALAFVANGANVPQLDVRGATLWSGKGVSAGLSWDQVLEREGLPASDGGQPGAIVVEICKAVTIPA